MIRKQRTKLGLRAKIKDYMDDVSIDVFGHEKKVTDNIKRYLFTLSKEHSLPEAGINIRIAYPNQILETLIYHFDRKIRPATFKELVEFFMGPASVDLFDLERKVQQNIWNYISQYSSKSNIPINYLNVRVSKPSDSITIMMCRHTESLENIPLKELIKYFK